ncbi:hypothetical protein NZK33_07570 [Cyanobium sp. FGCU-6]|nr:hypothetical protein [Cyanobium sp. FGCU6]
MPPDERIASFVNDGTLWSERPMLERLAAFRAAGSTSCGRPRRIPPGQVVGWSGLTGYYNLGNSPRQMREPRMEVLFDGPGEPVVNQRAIGRRPIAVFGNSEGDHPAMQCWVTSVPGPSLGMPVHQDHARREVAHHRSSPFGRPYRGLVEAPARGWGLISMQADRAEVYAGRKVP